MNYTYNCKMCGAPLEVDSDSKIITCQYCGRPNTISLNGEKSARLLNDANQSRLSGDFEQAKSKYFAIINEYVEEPEAYWGLFLCEYGVSYVNDPISGAKVPTCYKHILNSVYTNDYYKKAVGYAESEDAAALYERYAKEIDEIQHEIAHSAQNKYDIFISYKETDDLTKSRTEDSNLAYEIYFELEKKGYNVFFARKTLPKGIPYEPVIFSALKSSKVMIVLGTKPEYINAPWVKNEWERYIHAINQGEDKRIVVAYKGFDPYLLPDKLQQLQGINLNDITALSDIKEFAEKNIRIANIKQVIHPTGENAVINYLIRAKMFMAAGKWNKADEYCERVLDAEPTNSTAYLYKFLIEQGESSLEYLYHKAVDFSDSAGYKNAVEFADEKLKTDLGRCRKRCIYNIAVNKKKTAGNSADYMDAIEIFSSVRDFADSDNQISECIAKAKAAFTSETEHETYVLNMHKDEYKKLEDKKKDIDCKTDVYTQDKNRLEQENQNYKKGKKWGLVYFVWWSLSFVFPVLITLWHNEPITFTSVFWGGVILFGVPGSLVLTGIESLWDKYAKKEAERNTKKISEINGKISGFERETANLIHSFTLTEQNIKKQNEKLSNLEYRKNQLLAFEEKTDN